MAKKEKIRRKKFRELNRHGKINRILYYGVILSFIVPIIYILVRMITGNTPGGEPGGHSTADYMLMLVQCAVGLAVINIPAIMARELKFELPVVLYSMYIVFLYCAIFLGEVRSFYYVIPFWDSILHSFSSLMLGAFGFMLVSILNRNKDLTVQLSPFFVALFSFCFALAVGALWEIYEFACDGLLGFNMQKFRLEDGTLLVGHEALSDTMKDIIIDALGALVSAVVGYISIKNEKLWFYSEHEE